MNRYHHPRCPAKPYEGLSHYAGPMPPCYCQEIYNSELFTNQFRAQQQRTDPQINLSRLTELMQALRDGKVERVTQSTAQEIKQLQEALQRANSSARDLREENRKLHAELGKWKMKRHNTLLTLRSTRNQPPKYLPNPVGSVEASEYNKVCHENEQLKLRLANAEAFLRGGR